MIIKGVLVGTAAILVGSQIWVTYSVRKTEIQKYTVIHKEGEIEIRHYPEAILASVDLPVSSYASLSGSGFRKLASYIFGSNQRGEQIAMTSPVHMQMGDSISSMSFVMPSGYSMESLPVPSDGSVKLHTSEEEYAVAIQFGGFVSDEKLKKKENELKDWLLKQNIPASGPFKYLGYNPPYQLVDRRNEVIVKIEKSQIEKYL